MANTKTRIETMKKLEILYSRLEELESKAVENMLASSEWYPEEHLDATEAEELGDINIEIDELQRLLTSKNEK